MGYRNIFSVPKVKLLVEFLGSSVLGTHFVSSVSGTGLSLLRKIFITSSSFLINHKEKKDLYFLRESSPQRIGLLVLLHRTSNLEINVYR